MKLTTIIFVTTLLMIGANAAMAQVTAEPSGIQYIKTDQAPLPLGHYSQATVYNGIVYAAGVLGMFPDKPNYVGNIEEQTEQALKNLQAILSTAHSDLDHVLTVTIYITDIKDSSKVNAVYARMFGNHKPARVMVTSPNLARGFGIEIAATAAVKTK